MRSVGRISSHSKILNTFETNFIQKIEQWVVLDCCYVLLGQPVHGSHCCEDGLRLCSKNAALCVVERIPHSFFIDSILVFFTVLMSLQSWGSKICTRFCRCKGVCLVRFPTKIAEHRLLFIAQPCVSSQPSFLESSRFFRFPSILIRFLLINTLFFCITFLRFTLASNWSEKAF